MAKNPFTLTIYDKHFVRQGWLGDPLRLDAVIRHNNVSTLKLTLASNSRKIPLLQEKGARLVCEYEDGHLVSGMVRATGGSSAGRLEFDVIDDYRLVTRVQGWPSPGSALSATTPTAQPAEYHTVSGPAENVAKALIRANAVTRLGLPVTVEPDLGRGRPITVSVRFHPLADRLFPAFDAAGVGLSVKQQGSGLYVSVYEPSVYDKLLSEASGVVQEWNWVNKAPEATRGVVGGQGEGTARLFQSFVDVSRETEWGDVVEVFRDARDTSSGSVYTERANETLAEGSEKSGLSVRFSETANFRYGRAFTRGDQVSLQVGYATVTDLLREVKFTWTPEKGLETTPQVGEINDSSDATLAKALRKTAAAIRTLRSR